MSFNYNLIQSIKLIISTKPNLNYNEIQSKDGYRLIISKNNGAPQEINTIIFDKTHSNLEQLYGDFISKLIDPEEE